MWGTQTPLWGDLRVYASTKKDGARTATLTLALTYTSHQQTGCCADTRGLTARRHARICMRCTHMMKKIGHGAGAVHGNHRARSWRVSRHHCRGRTVCMSWGWDVQIQNIVVPQPAGNNTTKPSGGSAMLVWQRTHVHTQQCKTGPQRTIAAQSRRELVCICKPDQTKESSDELGSMLTAV